MGWWVGGAGKWLKGLGGGPGVCACVPKNTQISADPAAFEVDATPCTWCAPPPHVPARLPQRQGSLADLQVQQLQGTTAYPQSTEQPIRTHLETCHSSLDYLQVQHIEARHPICAHVAAVPAHRLIAAAAEGQGALPCGSQVQ